MAAQPVSNATSGYEHLSKRLLKNCREEDKLKTLLKNSFESREEDKLKHVLHLRSTVCKRSGACFSLPGECFSNLLADGLRIFPQLG
jgi:hypothetical protein